MKSLLLSLILFGWFINAHAVVETRQFETPQQRLDYDELIFELRCLVCQNQNLADSNAQLAQDLRQQVYEMLTNERKDKNEIIDYMVNRYGEFVLYKPTVEPHTYLLWAGPFALLILGLFILIRMIKRNNQLAED